jgi:hypothetical protein
LNSVCGTGSLAPTNAGPNSKHINETSSNSIDCVATVVFGYATKRGRVTKNTIKIPNQPRKHKRPTAECFVKQYTPKEKQYKPKEKEKFFKQK